MTYEYFCAACGHQWELEQSIKEPPARTCPSCKAEAARRQISGGQGFILKGGGWYADGYGSSKGGGAGSTSASSKADSSTSEKKTEPTKTETKTESSKADTTKS